MKKHLLFALCCCTIIFSACDDEVTGGAGRGNHSAPQQKCGQTECLAAQHCDDNDQCVDNTDVTIGDPCRLPSQCISGATCTNNTCQAISQDCNPPCSDSEDCVDKVCTPKPECKTKSDCDDPTNMVCQKGKCLQYAPIGGECSTEDNSPISQRCNRDIAICHYNRCIKRPQLGEDCSGVLSVFCPKGSHCSTSNICVKDAKEGETCDDTHLCASNAYCSTEGKCVNYANEGEECNENKKCKENLLCGTKNKCIATHGECTTNKDCGTDSYCCTMDSCSIKNVCLRFEEGGPLDTFDPSCKFKTKPGIFARASSFFTYPFLSSKNPSLLIMQT